MKNVCSVLLVAGLLLGASKASPVQAQGNTALITELVKEHNRVRTKPSEVLAELKREKDALIAARVKGGEPKAEATKAIESCIADLENIVAKHKTGLGALTESAEGNKAAQSFADKLGPSTHPAAPEIFAKWKELGYKGLGATSESIASLPGKGTDAEKAKEIVRSLLIDWGASNISSGYFHRRFILDYELVSVTPHPAPRRMKAIGIAIKGESVRIQYAR
jgi:hypothetical protein